LGKVEEGLLRTGRIFWVFLAKVASLQATAAAENATKSDQPEASVRAIIIITNIY
jgi:hypothetical protein